MLAQWMGVAANHGLDTVARHVGQVGLASDPGRV